MIKGKTVFVFESSMLESGTVPYISLKVRLISFLNLACMNLVPYIVLNPLDFVIPLPQFFSTNYFIVVVVVIAYRYHIFEVREIVIFAWRLYLDL